MAVKDTENKSLSPDEDKDVVRAANGVPTTGGDSDPTKLVEVTLAGHYRHDGEDYIPGDKIKVKASLAQSLRTAGYAVREG